ncbi:hypothetical protein ACJJTC_015784 [Scirpophaga incertulas]
MADQLKTLIKRRSSMKSKLTIFNNYLNLIKDHSGLSETQRYDLEERFSKFECLYADFDALQVEIEVLVEDADTVLAEREEFETQYFRLVALARSVLGSTSKLAGKRTY